MDDNPPSRTRMQEASVVAIKQSRRTTHRRPPCQCRQEKLP